MFRESRHTSYLKARTLNGAALVSFLAALPHDAWIYVVERTCRAARFGDRWSLQFDAAAMEAWARRED